jgi:exodeoxyribonuclease V alpha subunit
MPAAADHHPVAGLLADLFGAGGEAGAAVTALVTRERDGHTGVEISAAEAAALVAAGLATAGEDLGEGEPITPLVLEGCWLTSRRHWRHERNLARWLTRSATAALPSGIPASELAAWFPSPARSPAGADHQRRAVALALDRRLTIVTGGPGTGKTTVAGRVLAALARQALTQGSVLPVTVLAAPTGKASARLTEAVRGELMRAGMPADGLAALTAWPSTLHRLFHHPGVARIEVLVVDELGMADASALDRVLTRLPARVRVLLLGDPDQLASVAPGRVLADLVGVPARHPLAEATIRLRVNWRSGQAPALAALIEDLQTGGGDAARLLATPAPAEHTGPATWIHRADLPASPAQLVDRLLADHAGWFAALARAGAEATGDGPRAALARLEELRWLTILRRDAWGCEALNRMVDERFCARFDRVMDGRGHYPGRPVLMTRNRSDLRLANGDLGVVQAGAGQPVVHFPDVDGTRAIPLHRLDGLESAWFLTVHKAQGSQGTQVEVIGLPPGASLSQSALATRELAYTAITRAARRLRIWWGAESLATALATREASRRRSGLAVQLARQAIPI